MPWPLPSHFSSMLQKPQAAFRDPRLRACTVERNVMGQPRPWAGAFAVVYKGIDASEWKPLSAVAVRKAAGGAPWGLLLWRGERSGNIRVVTASPS